MEIRWIMMIMTSVITIIIIYVAQWPVEAAVQHEGVLWRFMKVSKGRLLARTTGGYNITTERPTSIAKMSCILACQKLPWCNIWCEDPDSGSSCSFFEMFIVGNYEETNLTDAVPCYTRSPSDYTVGATIEGAVPRSSTPQRVKELLIDGIYPLGNKDECYWSGDQWDPWVKINLGSPKPIRYVRMVPQSNTKAEQMYDIEIRAGNVDVAEGNIQDNSVFGYFAGPAVPSEMAVLTQEPPVMAQFVTVQRISDRAACLPDESTISQVCGLHLCHIEISN